MGSGETLGNKPKQGCKGANGVRERAATLVPTLISRGKTALSAISSSVFEVSFFVLCCYVGFRCWLFMMLLLLGAAYP
jgi:hypothetical protein